MEPNPTRVEVEAEPNAAAAALWQLPLFNACSRAEIATAGGLLQPRVAPAGTAFDATMLATESYLVVAGQALATDDRGVTSPLATGDLFGLLRLALDDSPVATVVALTSLDLLVADERASARLLRLDGVALALVHGAAARRRAHLRVEG